MNGEYPNALPIGTRLGEFEITQVLGAGSFGITYQAMDHTLQRMVAIKEYMPAGFATREADRTTLIPLSDSTRDTFHYGLRRFLDEARTVARFNAPSIVRISQFMEANGTAYFIMDYVDGQPLDEHIKCQNMNEGCLREVMVALLKGLRVVHQHKYLHRDIKPGNIYIRHDGEPILLDFGCARQRVESATQSMTTMGTPAYAPFEQFHDDESQSPATDLYSLGATMYHCITGKAPPSCSARIAALHDDRPDPIDRGFEAASNRFSTEFLKTLYWMLEPFPSDRPQSVDEVLADLGVTTSSINSLSAPAAQYRTPMPSERERMPTEPLDANSVPVAAWPDELVQNVQSVLQGFVGPLAGPLVAQATRRTRQVDTLLTMTASCIDDANDRERFLQQARDVLRPAPPPVPAYATRDRSEVETAVARPERPVTARPLIPEQKLEQVQSILAEYMGPIARVLITKVSKKSSDSTSFYRLLAQELDDENERSEFLKRVHQI